MEEIIKDFVNTRLNGGSVPADLKVLLLAFSKNRGFTESTNNPLFHIGADLLWANKTYSLLDHDYLNDQDKADPDIMANVAAMQETNKTLKFVLQDEDSSLLGYWQPNPETPLDHCTLFWLDTEGQYNIAEGRTLAETLAYRALVDANHDLCLSITEAFEQLGILIPTNEDDKVFTGMDERQNAVCETPQDYRARLYERYSEASGR